MVVIGVILLIAVPLVITLRLESERTHPKPPPLGIPVNATLSLGRETSYHLANPFYAVVFGDDGTPTAQLQETGAYLNSTPISWFRFGGNGSSYDPTSGTYYVAPPGGGTYQPTSFEVWNLTWFKSWCEARDPHCLWLGYLPGEENVTSFAVHTAEWFHTQLGLAPEYWQLGNEPTGWTHFGVNLSSWSTYDDSTASDIGYATMVRNYIQAVTALYPDDRFVGLEASCGCDTSEAETTASVDGGLISAMSYHNYPSTGGSSSSLTGFYGALTSNTNLTNNLARYSGAVSAGCAGCSALPLQVGEYQSGPAQSFSPYAATYAGAVFLGASVIQALETNVSMFTVFDSGALFNAARDAPTFQGLLYQRILDNLTMGYDYETPLSDQGVGGVYSVVVHNGSRSALLLVNTNTTYALNLTIPALAFPVGTTGSVWQWQPNEPTPTTTRNESLPTTYLVSAQGILLLTTY